MTSLREMEIQALPAFLQGHNLVMRIVLHDKLFQIEECSSVCHLLSHLRYCIEGVRCERLLAVIALLVYDLELHHHGLLQHARILYLLLHCEFNFHTLGVLFCPYERSIDEPDFFSQAFDPLQTYT